MTRLEYLETRIEALESRLDQLLGRPRGPITMAEYRRACEKKDRATMRRFLQQEEGGDQQSSGHSPGQREADRGSMLYGVASGTHSASGGHN